MIIWLLRYVIVQALGIGLALVSVGALVFLLIRRQLTVKWCMVGAAAVIIWLFMFWVVPYGMPGGLAIPWGLKTYGPADGPSLPMANLLEFFGKVGKMQHVNDIARNPNDVPPPITRTAPDHVKITLTAKEVIGKMADGVEFNYWTFNGTVPGPLLRVREGDTVDLTLKNDPTSVHHHSIDLHAVTGPGGGATVSSVMPGESKTFTFKAMNPGLFVYHCATSNVAVHMAHGMYGMILVEPKGGLPKVDHEYYVMQGEAYSTGALGKKGLQLFDAQAMLDGKPQYIVFNGRTGGVSGKIKLKTGEKVRIYVGNGGVNEVSSFHMIGEIFDNVYPEGSMGVGAPVEHNVQTTMVPAGGAAAVEFTADVPGRYIMVDHALARMDRGAWGTIEVTGEPKPEIFKGTPDMNMKGH